MELDKYYESNKPRMRTLRRKITKTISVELDEETVRYGKTMAGARSMTFSAHIRQLLREQYDLFLDRKNKEYGELKKRNEFSYSSEEIL
jgi:ribosomal protein S24E